MVWWCVFFGKVLRFFMCVFFKIWFGGVYMLKKCITILYVRFFFKIWFGGVYLLKKYDDSLCVFFLIMVWLCVFVKKKA